MQAGCESNKDDCVCVEKRGHFKSDMIGSYKASNPHADTHDQSKAQQPQTRPEFTTPTG